ncbi:MAG: protein translocase subunit SecF [Candidatus Pacebacteria bacterium]|nr:protein translocase subunit SecF [Candidatus Paceibacterota bacterium]
MFIIKYKSIFLAISAVLVFGSLFLVATKGIKKGIDFTGGTEVVVTYKGFTTTSDGKIDLELIKNNISDAGFRIKDVALKSMNADGSANVDIKLTGGLSNEDRVKFENAWSFNHDEHYEAKQISENIIGPSIGKELASKALWSIFIVSLVIILFVAFSFRHVSKPISSWKYGLITVATLIHDVAIPTGMYAVLGERNGAEIDSLFIIALLTIMGISISDTIVVFDRIRENLKNKKSNEIFSEVVGKSLSQTLLRSLNTSFAVIIVLFALFHFGPVSIHNFSLTLIVGMIVGTYSSIFVASPLLVIVEKFQRK